MSGWGAPAAVLATVFVLIASGCAEESPTPAAADPRTDGTRAMAARLATISGQNGHERHCRGRAS